MEPIEYIRVIRRRWRLLAACLLIAGVAAWITTPAHPTNNAVTYQATHQILRDSEAPSPQALATVALFVKTGEVPRRAAARVEFTGQPAVLAARVTLEPDDTTGTLGITATGGTRAEAAALANAFAEETLGYLGEQAQKVQRDQLKTVTDRLSTLQIDIGALDEQIKASGGTDGLLAAERDSKLRDYGVTLDQQQQIINQPPPSAGYITLQEALPELASAAAGGFSAPRGRTARTGLALLLGLALGIGGVFAAERFDTRLHTLLATQDAFGLPVIAEVPAVAEMRAKVVTALDPMSSLAEAHRTLRSSLLLMPVPDLARGSGGPPKAPQVILVTSAAPGEGKTTTVANLAAGFAEAGYRVLVLGCDFRRPEIHIYFDQERAPGIADVLVKGERDLASVIRPTNLHGVRLAASGTKLRNLGDVAAAGPALIAEARKLADIVLIDTAPLLATSEATELIPACDAVVIVARVGRTSTDNANRTRTLLRRLAAPAAGVVLVGVPASESAYSPYYTSISPQPPGRAARLLRYGRSEDIDDRIQHWRGSAIDPGAQHPVTPLVPGPTPLRPQPGPAPRDQPPPEVAPAPPDGTNRVPEAPEN